MHQIVLLTALTATSGLFGFGRQRAQYYPTQGYYNAGGYTTCAGGYCNQTVAAPAPAPAAAPVQQAAAPAPQPAQTVQRIQYTYPQRYVYPTTGYYYTSAPVSGCPGGNCYRR